MGSKYKKSLLQDSNYSTKKQKILSARTIYIETSSHLLKTDLNVYLFGYIIKVDLAHYDWKFCRYWFCS